MQRLWETFREFSSCCCRLLSFATLSRSFGFIFLGSMLVGENIHLVEETSVETVRWCSGVEVWLRGVKISIVGHASNNRGRSLTFLQFQHGHVRCLRRQGRSGGIGACKTAQEDNDSSGGISACIYETAQSSHAPVCTKGLRGHCRARAFAAYLGRALRHSVWRSAPFKAPPTNGVS